MYTTLYRDKSEKSAVKGTIDKVQNTIRSLCELFSLYNVEINEQTYLGLVDNRYILIQDYM